MSEYIVTKAEPITRSTLLLTLQLKAGPPLLFQAGQYAAIHGYRGKRPMPIRCFSIVSSPTSQAELQFSMRIRGRFTRAIASLQPGQKVHVQGPYGGFVLNTHMQNHIVLLAGGIGITPFMSMIRFAGITQLATKLDLIYSVADQDDVPFGAELLEWQGRNPNFRSNFVIDHGPVDQFPGTQTASGRISPEIIESTVGHAMNDSRTVFYICGPPPFMRGMESMLRSKGVEKHRIMTEAFSQGPNHQTGKLRDWPFSMYALGALGLSAGGMAIMVADLGSIIPPKDSLLTSPVLTTKQATNSRQTDLDSLVNALPNPGSAAAASPAVRKALSVGGSTGAAVNSTSSSTSTIKSPAPTPVQTPKCTTTQSGVTQC